MTPRSVFALLLFGLLTSPAIADQTLPAPTPIGPTDAYGGLKAIESEATGFFRVEQINGRWLFITPEGHGYVALGANHIGKFLDREVDKPLNEETTVQFAGDRAAALATIRAGLDAMHFNAGEAYAPIAEGMKDRPWVANVHYPFGSKFAFDVFDPAVIDRLRQSIEQQTAAFRDDPMVLGVAFSDLPVWDERRLRFYENLPADAPGAKVLAQYRADGQSDVAFLAHVADVQYAAMKKATAEFAPNHLFFGERFYLRSTPTPILAAVGKHVDVVCTQALILSAQRPPEWQTFQPGGYRAEQALSGKPVVVIDWAAPFSLSATYETDRGTIESERIAADAAADWLVAALEEPYIIGVFRCQFIGTHGNDRWFEGQAKRTYLQDDGTPFSYRSRRTAAAQRTALLKAYAAAMP